MARHLVKRSIRVACRYSGKIKNGRYKRSLTGEASGLLSAGFLFLYEKDRGNADEFERSEIRPDLRGAGKIPEKKGSALRRAGT